jgi:hypothetical protein
MIRTPIEKEDMMPGYIEYELEEGLSILVKTSEEIELDSFEAETVKAGIAGRGFVPRAEKSFSDSLDSVRIMGLQLKEKLEDLRADEVEVTFGLVTSGKVGNFAIAETGIEANFEVTLTWKNTGKTD